MRYLQFHLLCDKLCTSVILPPVLVGNVVGEPCVTIAREVFSKSLESEDFWERTGKAGGISALKEDKKITGGIASAGYKIALEPLKLSSFCDCRRQIRHRCGVRRLRVSDGPHSH